MSPAIKTDNWNAKQTNGEDREMPFLSSGDLIAKRRRPTSPPLL